MRRIARAPIEVFNLSFLDIISCAFGAVVMLVLLSKNGEQIAPPDGDATGISSLIDQVIAARQSVDNMQGALSTKEDSLMSAKAEAAAASYKLEDLEQEVPKALATLKQLDDQANSIRQDIANANSLLNVPSSTEKPDEDVGGVPTDAEYVVFIIDNSGSMVNIGWNKVIDVVKDVIQNHPKLKGFNIMAADGTFMPMKSGGWIRDTVINRRTAMIELKQFRGGASAPEQGILKAIKTYKSTIGNVSLYVFGDEFTSSNLQHAVAQINSANLDSQKKQPKFRIHGIGFQSGTGRTSQGFAAFMKSVATHNRGAFIALEI